MDDAVRTAQQLVTEARKAAAERRLSSIGDLERYLRSRFAYRNGELLLLDPNLLSGDVATITATITMLEALDRPIRRFAATSRQRPPRSCGPTSMCADCQTARPRSTIACGSRISQ